MPVAMLMEVPRRMALRGLAPVNRKLASVKCAEPVARCLDRRDGPDLYQTIQSRGTTSRRPLSPCRVAWLSWEIVAGSRSGLLDQLLRIAFQLCQD